MGVRGIVRIEEFKSVSESFTDFDPMISQKYTTLTQDIYTIDVKPEAILEIDDVAAYNKQEGLALNEEEVQYLDDLATKIGRKLTDSEVFGFSQFAPKTADKPDFYQEEEFDSVISIKAETHNFPTTVEPFNGAATGAGGEIRDRLAGGKGSLPLAGTAVYMTAYSRLEESRPWEDGMPAREWLYQTPMDILIKASNGASDFGNKFGQPLITGSVLTFEHAED
ncbi:putative phosphoribosylformylglycinamidine synthase, chloroplastic/mitochondrial [Nymphon striatum]|nr:putative phosphoribosylformylglycinamidine synthase, chloroplastic/mitochondrial [Nymphon striatum]